MRGLLHLAVLLSASSLAVARGLLPAVNYPAGSDPFAVAVADFNGDNKPDMAVVNNSAGTVSILAGRGDGTFVPAKTYNVCRLPVRLASGDLNGDGRADLVVTCHTGLARNIAVMLNNGSGFLRPQLYEDGGTGPSPVVVADFDQDGILDLVVGDGSLVSFLKGNGDGSFGPPETSSPGHNLQSFMTADFNRDGHLDVAAADGTMGGILLLGNGDGTFQSPVYIPDSLAPLSVAGADFNGDGYFDLVLANSVKTVTIALGNGDGTFQPPTTLKAGKGPRSVAVGDFNGDGASDIAVAVVEAGGVAVMYGRGDGTFPALRKFRTDGFNGAWYVAAVDVNHDRADDLEVVNRDYNSVSILMNSGGTFVTTTSSQNPVPVGQPVTLTTTVDPSLSATVPTGSITFKDEATLLGTVPLDESGEASLTTSDLGIGTHSIKTKYSGDPNYNPNTGKPISQVVQ